VLVELRGLEPLTPCLQSLFEPFWAVSAWLLTWALPFERTSPNTESHTGTGPLKGPPMSRGESGWKRSPLLGFWQARSGHRASRGLGHVGEWRALHVPPSGGLPQLSFVHGERKAEGVSSLPPVSVPRRPEL
jgi:hypothetical protein